MASALASNAPCPGKRMRRGRENTGVKRFAIRAQPTPGSVQANVPADHPAAVALAEREVQELNDQIAEAESRVGVLRLQRKNLMDWLLRNAVSTDDSSRPSQK